MALDALFKHNAAFYTDSLIHPGSESASMIRLLHIRPGRFEDPISCDLSTVELHKQVDYTALSYVWGKHEVPQQIQINGRPDFWVTQNAFAAMRRLRQRNQEGLTVWIDAICIKQTDLDERSAQVSIMGKIYQNARTVFVYLGCCAGQPVGEPELENCEKQTFHDDVEMVRGKANADDESGRILQNNDDEDKGSGPYQWWQRCWTIQEAILAREIIFLFGSHCYTLAQLNKLASTDFLPVRLCRTLDDLSGKGLYGELRPEHRESDDDDDETGNFIGLLMAAAARHATDPRDKVYSVLGLDNLNQPKIGVDYSKPTETVAFETTMALLESEDESEWGKKLYIVHSVFGFAYREAWISWVPDFCSSGLLRQGDLFDSLGEDGVKQRYGRKASKQKQNGLSISGKTLRTQGLELDSIAFVVELHDIPSEQENFKRTAKAQWLAQRIQSQLPDCDQKLQGHKCELAKLNRHKDTPEWRAIRPRRNQMDRLTHHLSYAGIMAKRSLPGHANQEKHFGYRLLHPISGKETTRASLDWEIIVDMIQPGSCLFITDSGFIGYATPAARIGDTVAVIFNFPDVMVLRRTTESVDMHRMVSEALVPSIQDGQLVQLHKMGKIQAKDFTFV